MKKFKTVAILTTALSSASLFSIGCGGNALNSLGNPPVVSAQQSYSTASLSGAYSFNESGSKGTEFHDGSGTLQFDGKGNVTGTLMEYYVGSSPCQFSLAGTYSVSSSASGTGNLTTTSTDSGCIGTSGTVDIQVAQQGQSLVYAESDGQRLEAGNALKQ